MRERTRVFAVWRSTKSGRPHEYLTQVATYGPAIEIAAGEIKLGCPGAPWAERIRLRGQNVFGARAGGQLAAGSPAAISVAELIGGNLDYSCKRNPIRDRRRSLQNQFQKTQAPHEYSCGERNARSNVERRRSARGCDEPGRMQWIG